MKRQMSAVLALQVCAAAVLVLSGCTAIQTSRPAPSASPSPSTHAASKASCLGPISYPGLDLTDLNQSLPIVGVTESYVQYEIEVQRGTGSCVDQDLDLLVMNPCLPVAGMQSSIVDEMLGATPDDLTTVEFARGATQALTEMGTGHTQSNGAFQYRLSAWHFDSSKDAEGSVVTSIVKSCAGAEVDGSRIHVDADGVPRVVAFRTGQDVFLVENMQNISPDGTRGLVLSTAAINTIEEWWQANAASYFDSGRVAPSNAA